MASPRGDPPPGPSPARSRGEAVGIDELFELVPRQGWRRLPGRETFAWPGREERIVKRFRGDAPRERWFERLHGRAVRSPARREADNLAALAADGIPVPRVLGAADEGAAGAGRGARSGLVMERVAYADTLRERLASCAAPDVGPWVRRLAALVVRLHARGWYHRDLYLEHVVVAADPLGPAGAERLVLLDAGRARRQRSPRLRWFVKDLAALWLSSPARVSRATRLRFLRAWLQGTGRAAGRAERRALARAVLAKARRLAAHAPRHVHEPWDAARTAAPAPR